MKKIIGLMAMCVGMCIVSDVEANDIPNARNITMPREAQTMCAWEQPKKETKDDRYTNSFVWTAICSQTTKEPKIYVQVDVHSQINPGEISAFSQPMADYIAKHSTTSTSSIVIQAHANFVSGKWMPRIDWDQPDFNEHPIMFHNFMEQWLSLGRLWTIECSELEFYEPNEIVIGPEAKNLVFDHKAGMAFCNRLLNTIMVR